MKARPLSELCDIAMGQAPDGSSYNTDGCGLPLIAGASDLGELTPQPSRWTATPTQICRQGDIVLCIRATIGDRNWADREYCLGRGVAGLRAKPGKLESRYLWHWLSAATPRLLHAARGATFLQVSRRDIESLAVSAPESLAEQRRIADILDKADAIRRKRKDAIAITDELLRSAFLEMFGDPVTNPKGWEVKPLGTFLGFVTSGSRGWAEHYADHGARFIRSLDVQMDHISDEDSAYVTVPSGAEAERTRVQPNDVLLTITGSKIGRAALADETRAGAYVSQHVAILRVLPGLDADVLTAFLVSDRGGQGLIARAQYGQTKPGLNLAQIRAFPIPIPPERLQAKIRAVRRDIHSLQRRSREAWRSANDLFESLVRRAFRSEPLGPRGSTTVQLATLGGREAE